MAPLAPEYLAVALARSSHQLCPSRNLIRMLRNIC
jgi:hypothetical protein